MQSKLAGVSVLVGFALAMASCSSPEPFSINGDPVPTAAESLIAGDLADDLDLGELEPTCEQIEDPQIGSDFTCTATTSDGQVIEFSGVVDAEDHLEINATNVVDAESVKTDLLEALTEDEVAAEIQLDEIDCGEGSIVVGDEEITCTITPPSGEPGSATVTFTDLASGAFDYDFTAPVPESAAIDELTQGFIDASLIKSFGEPGEWEQSPVSEDELSTEGLAGCEFFEDLLYNDGFIIEAESPQFSSGDISFYQAVRLYQDPETAIDVINQWGEEETVNCYIDAVDAQAQLAFDAGELDPFHSFEVGGESTTDRDGDLRLARVIIHMTMYGDDQQPIFLSDVYLLQQGRVVSMLAVESQDNIWDGALEVLELVLLRQSVMAGLLSATE